jgi:hypothetical protein
LLATIRWRRISASGDPNGAARRPGRYAGFMVLPRAKTAEEVIERMRHAAPATPDDVTILWDGRRLDSRQAVMEWLGEVDAKRAEETASADARV